MRYIDFHCDTLSVAMAAGEATACSLKNASVDTRRLVEAGAEAQFFACFLNQAGRPEEYGLSEMPDHFTLFLKMRDEYLATLDTDPGIARAWDAASLEENKKKGLVSAFLTIENAFLVEGQTERLEELRRLGVSLMTLTWNHENCFGYPNSRDPEAMMRGLKPFGREAIGYMNELGLIVDVSHLSDGGFYDVAALSRKPFVASHSNARALAESPRNLTDDMIRILGEHGGIAGLNFFPPFLHNDPGDFVSRVEEMCTHVEHMLRVGGEDLIAIGSDFDGIGGELEIASPLEMERLFGALESRHIPGRVLDKLAYQNAERVIRDCL